MTAKQQSPPSVKRLTCSAQYHRRVSTWPKRSPISLIFIYPSILKQRRGVIARLSEWRAWSAHTEGIVYVTGNLAAVALRRTDWPRAEALAREALSLSKKVGRKELIAVNAQILARALVRQGKVVEAVSHARRAVDILSHFSAHTDWRVPVQRSRSASPGSSTGSLKPNTS